MKTTVATFLIGAVVLSAVAYLWIGGRSQESPAQDLIDKCLAIQSGMSRAEVIRVMGGPKRTHYAYTESLPTEIWYYHSGKTVSTPTRITFDSSTGLVIDAVCGEDRTGVRRPFL